MSLLVAPSCRLIPNSTSFTVGGHVAGLTGQGLVLSLAGHDDLAVGANGRFAFSTELEDGDGYAVTIAAQPTNPPQSCVVLGGSGRVGMRDVDDVDIACSLVLGSFNLEWFAGTSSDSKKTGIAGVIRSAGFGLLTVEEVSSPADLAAFADQFLGPDWSSRLGDSGLTQRVGLLYRKPLVRVLESGELGLQRTGGRVDETAYPWAGLRLPYWARVQIEGTSDTFEVVGVHLKAMSDAESCATRAAQVSSLESWLATREGDPLIVTGDFNDMIPGTGMCTSVDTLAPFEADAQLTFLTQPPTMDEIYYSSVNYRSTIDHILVTPSLLGRLEDLDGQGHKAAVYMHRNDGISDHQPPYVYMGW
jgi:endonuclease/exonuclease/phosphatase family metal-dependent hydrolase